MKLLGAAERVSEPWRNGRGITTPVAGAKGWRVSIAEIRDDSRFSRFPGADRLLVPLTPPGLWLSVNGQVRRCDLHAVCTFAGEDAVHAPEITAPIEVLNLISERARHHGTVQTVTVPGSMALTAGDVEALIVVIARGDVTADGTALGRLDGLWLTSGETATISGRGDLILVRVADSTRCPDRPCADLAGEPRGSGCGGAAAPA